MDSWTADDSCGEGCAQLDDFNWFLPADDQVGDLPAPESQVDLSDSESDVDDVEPDPVPVQMTTMAVESLCPPVVTQTRPKEGCDPASPRRLRRGRDVLMEDSMVAVNSRRISIAPDTDVVPDPVPVQMATTAVESLCPPVVTQTRTVVAEVWMERFVLVPEACPFVSMTSTVARTFGPALSEEYSPVVLAGGGGRLLRHTPWSW